MRRPYDGLLPRALLLAALAAVPCAALPCSICACGDPLLAASDPAAITGELRLQVDLDHLRVDAGTEGRPGYTDRLTQWSYRLNVAYRPLETLSLTATLPIVSKSIRTVGGGTATVSSDLTGLGDVEVAARYRLFRAIALGVGRVHELALTGGAAVPTGGNRAKDRNGMPVDPHGQLGTGAWGPFVGLNYGFEQGRLLAFANVSGRLRTEGAFAGGVRYHFGDALLWSVHGQYRPVRRLALDLGLDGRHARVDRATAPDGTRTAVENTGGTVLAVAPGVYANATGPLWLFLRAQVPAFESLFGEQRVLPSFTTGIQLELL